MNSELEGKWGSFYEPSVWSKRYPTREQALDEHATFIKMGKNPFRFLSFSISSPLPFSSTAKRLPSW